MHNFTNQHNWPSICMFVRCSRKKCVLLNVCDKIVQKLRSESRLLPVVLLVLVDFKTIVTSGGLDLRNTLVLTKITYVVMEKFSGIYFGFWVILIVFYVVRVRESVREQGIKDRFSCRLKMPLPSSVKMQYNVIY